MPRARTLLVLLAAVLVLASPAQAFEPEKTGIVVLHGKHGNPGNFIASYVGVLRQAGFVVEAPETAWSGRRRYDVGYGEALAEVGSALQGLRARGVERVVLIGHSMGAGAALAYAARNVAGTERGGPELAALVCLAPGHTPEVGKQRDLIVAEVARASELAAQGRGGESIEFRDLNVGGTTDTRLSAEVFLDYFGPQGPAVMPVNAGMIKRPLPVLWLVGARDRATKPASYAFDRLPAHPASRYEALDADHIGTVRASAPVVIQWLKGL